MESVDAVENSVGGYARVRVGPSFGIDERQEFGGACRLARSASRSRMARPSWLISSRWSSTSSARSTVYRAASVCVGTFLRLCDPDLACPAVCKLRRCCMTADSKWALGPGVRSWILGAECVNGRWWSPRRDWRPRAVLNAIFHQHVATAGMSGTCKICRFKGQPGCCRSREPDGNVGIDNVSGGLSPIGSPRSQDLSRGALTGPLNWPGLSVTRLEGVRQSD